MSKPKLFDRVHEEIRIRALSTKTLWDSNEDPTRKNRRR